MAPQVASPQPGAGRPGIAVVDLSATSMSPAGSCVLAEVQGLSRHFDVTIFGDACDADGQPGCRFIRVPAPKRPVLLRYVAFHLLVALRYRLWRLGAKAPLFVQSTQGQLVGADVVYAHFCHRAYLRNQWGASTVAGVRRAMRRANHSFNAFFEARAFQRARRIVVPSAGLAKEMAAEYPGLAGKIVVLPNPVAVERFARPADFDRAGKRTELGLGAEHIVLGFMALGDFARKGLGLLIDALGQLPAAEAARFRLLVVGGQRGEIDAYRNQAARAGVEACIVFVGLQPDVRPFLWAADVFAFPSSYETFSLAIHQAAAAGLPVLASRGLYGAEELVVQDSNGWLIAREAGAIVDWLRKLPALAGELPRMSAAAVASVQRCSSQAFVQRWQELYAGLSPQAGGALAGQVPR